MFIRRFFSVLYLSVVVESRQCLLYGEAFKNGKLIKTIKNEFDNEDPNFLNGRIKEYIGALEKEYKWVYISLFFDALGQGAFEAKNADKLEKLGIETQNLNCIIPSKNWLIYAKNEEINQALVKFENIDIDLIYSPIALMDVEIKRHDLPTKNTLFIYSNKENFTICITSEEELKFASVCKLDEAEFDSVDEDTEFSNENSDEIDDFITDIDESFNNLDGLESLDEMLKVGGNEEEFADLDYDINMPASTDVTASVSIFGRDMSMYRYISLALKEFYSNPLYEGDFIENIVIFDNTIRTSATFLQYLQSELFVKTAVYPVDMQKSMVELMIKELKND